MYDIAIHDYIGYREEEEASVARQERARGCSGSQQLTVYLHRPSACRLIA